MLKNETKEVNTEIKQRKKWYNLMVQMIISLPASNDLQGFPFMNLNFPHVYSNSKL